MDKVRVRFAVILLILVLALVVVRSEGNRKFLEAFFGRRVSWISQDELDQETVEQMWVHCWKKIDCNSNTIPEFRLNHPYEIEKAINNLPPKSQESLLDCLTRRNLLLATSHDEPVSITWLDKLLDFLSDYSSIPRRQLKSRNRPRHRRKPKNANLDNTNLPLGKKHPRQRRKPENANLPLSKKHPRQHHKPENLPLGKKNPRQNHKPKSAKSPLRKRYPHQRHKPENATLALRKKRRPDQQNKPENATLALRKKRRPDQQNKPENATLALRKKKRPDQQNKPQTNTLIIPKRPRHNIAKSPKNSPLGLSDSLALAPSRTPTNAPAPAPIHISPEPSKNAPSPVPIPPSVDTSPPPLVAKPSPVEVSRKSEDDTRRYMIISLVTSAVAVFALMALLFFCCVKRGGDKVDTKDGQRDENPLLNLCLSRSIEDSAENPQGKENPEKNFPRTTTIANNNVSSSPYKSTEATQNNNNTPLAVVPPPPGKKSPPAPSAPPPPPRKQPMAPGPPPPPGAKPPPPAPLPRQRGRSSLGGSDDANGGSDSHKAKLKPFFWDKVSPDQSMVWQELKAGSFQVNEEMMETLFGYTVAEKTKHDERKGASPPQYIQIIDPKKSQNLSILLKALNVTTEEVCDALKEGTELPSELTQTLLKMAPTTEEELKLRLYDGEISMLGPAERFLKSVVEIPFAYKRMESLLFISSVQEEISSINDSFKTLEVACTELKNSRLFLKLLEAVLKTGNRMNDGTYRGDAQAFKLDTLLKLSDVKGTDGKTTLLHFVVQEIIRSEGVRAARALRESQSMSSLKSDDLNDDSTRDSSQYYRTLGLNVVSGLSNDLENVRKAAIIDGDGVTNTVYKLGHSLGKIKGFLENEIEGLEEESEFRKKVEDFLGHTEDEIKRLVGEEKRIMDLVKGTVDYFYGKGAKNEGLRLFVIVRDFLVILERVCKEVRSQEKTPVRAPRREALTPSTSSDSCMSVDPIDIRQRLFPAITANRRDDSSSDDESFSP